MTETTNDELATLRAAIAQRSPRIICVDGMNGVGKTHRVSKPLGLPIVSLDDHLLGDGRYVDGFRLDDLRRAIDSYSDAPTIIEGCCLLAVLDRLNIRPDHVQPPP